jgi:hypothetical protein
MIFAPACLPGFPSTNEFATAEGAPRLQPLAELLDGVRRTADERFASTLHFLPLSAEVTRAPTSSHTSGAVARQGALRRLRRGP